MTNYYSKFISNYSAITVPLHQILHQDVEWNWQEQHMTAFTKLKDDLMTTLLHFQVESSWNLPVNETSAMSPSAQIEWPSREGRALSQITAGEMNT